MTPEELREAIIGPAVRVDLTVETALVSRLISDTAGQPAVLPLLSHALLETWRRRSGMTLTLAGYEKSGGIQHALARSADAIYASLSRSQQVVARSLFLRLVAVNENAEDTKRRLPRRELESLGTETAVVLDKLVQARLLTVDEHGVELAHEALVRHWPRLADWLSEDRSGLRIHQQLTEAADGWESLGRDGGALYRGLRLSTALEWMTSRERMLSQCEKEFLHASRAVDRKRTRRLQQTIALLVCLVLAAALTSVYAVGSQQAALEQRNIALAQSVISQADALRDNDPVLAAQFRLAAYRITANATTTGSLLSTFAEPYSGRLAGHTKPVRDTAISADGRLLATASEDRTVRLWDFTTPEQPRQLAVIEHSEGLHSAGFSPDSKFLVTTTAIEPEVRIWSVADASRPELVATLPGAGARWSPDGRLLAVKPDSAVDEIQLWNVADPAKPARLGSLAGHDLPAFSPDSRLLAVPPVSGASLLWDISNAAAPQPLEAPFANPDDASAVDISPDGKALAIGMHSGNDWTTELWDMSDPRQRKQLATLKQEEGDDKPHGAVPAFSADGRSLITWAGDVQLWDVSDPSQPRAVRRIKPNTSASLTAIALSRDGKWLVSAGDDDVRMTDVAAFAMDGLHETAPRVEFSGNVLFGGAGYGKVRFWDVADPIHPKLHTSFAAPPDETVSVAKRSADGKVVATEVSDLTVELWDMTGPAAAQGSHDRRCHAGHGPQPGRPPARVQFDHRARHPSLGQYGPRGHSRPT